MLAVNESRAASDGGCDPNPLLGGAQVESRHASRGGYPYRICDA
jgi:hypothetical protein